MSENVTFSKAAVKLLILDHERQYNARTIRRLDQEIRDKVERLEALKKRQAEIDQTFAIIGGKEPAIVYPKAA